MDAKRSSKKSKSSRKGTPKVHSTAKTEAIPLEEAIAKARAHAKAQAIPLEEAITKARARNKVKDKLRAERRARAHKQAQDKLARAHTMDGNTLPLEPLDHDELKKAYQEQLAIRQAREEQQVRPFVRECLDTVKNAVQHGECEPIQTRWPWPEVCGSLPFVFNDAQVQENPELAKHKGKWCMVHQSCRLLYTACTALESTNCPVQVRYDDQPAAYSYGYACGRFTPYDVSRDAKFDKKFQPNKKNPCLVEIPVFWAQE